MQRLPQPRALPRLPEQAGGSVVAWVLALALGLNCAWVQAQVPTEIRVQTPAPAQELNEPTPAPQPRRLWLNAGFYSAHFDSGQGLRNANPGLGLEYSLSPTWSLTAGRFINSDNANSNYLGAYYQPWTLAGAKWGVVAGAFNGYPKAFGGGWFPALIPVASWEGERVGLNVALVPPLKDRLYGALSFQLKFRLN